ncbi:MAG TPA: hypothetical protein VFN67_24930 [Polyangiales bacterium]|nr:hypothetical protein [Polyangiales bacterium]
MATNAPRIAWFLNLDADRELQDPARYRAVELGAVRPDWRARMADLVAPLDIVLPSHEARPGEHVVQCFCPTPRALAALETLGFTPPEAPALSVLQRVNDRAFSAELGQCLPSASFVRDMDALEHQLAIASPTGRYVIKRAFSFAGREQRRVQNSELDASTRGFCERSFASGEGVQVEPWVERLADFSRHAYLTREGALTIGPTREQRCDEHGRFLGVMVDAPHVTQTEADRLADELQLVAAALSAAGYFGPFGIDGFRYRMPDGSIAFNPRCEINARFTMGYPRALLLASLGVG